MFFVIFLHSESRSFVSTSVSFLTKAAAFKAIWTSRIVSVKVGVRYYLFMLLVISDAAKQDVSKDRNSCN